MSHAVAFVRLFGCLLSLTIGVCCSTSESIAPEPSPPCGPLRDCSLGMGGAEAPPAQPTASSGVQRTNAELMAYAARSDLSGSAAIQAKAVDLPLDEARATLAGLVAQMEPAPLTDVRPDLVFVAAAGTGVPDTMGAAGPTQYLITLNSVVRSFSKATGQQDGVLDLSLQAFFGGAGLPACCDPKVRFDRLSGRWFVGSMFGAHGLLAVSDGGVLTASSRWTFFSFRQDAVPPAGDPGCWVDYTRMSVDEHAVYFVFAIVGANFGGLCPTNATRSSAFVIRKASVLGVGPLVATAFRGLAHFNVPADQYERGSDVGYISVLSSTGNGSYVRVLDPGGTPSLSNEMSYTGVPRAGLGVSAVRHPGNVLESGTPDNLSGRMFIPNHNSHSLPYRHGRLWVGSIWGVDNRGLQSWVLTRNGLGFVEVRDVHGNNPSVVQYGALFAASPANDLNQRSYWMPALMVNGQGHVVVSGNAAGTNEYINALSAARLSTDPPGALRGPVFFTQNGLAYNSEQFWYGTYRWGDYSDVSLDPTDDMTMWSVQQVPAGGNQWAIVVARIRAPGPPPTLSATPAIITQSTSSTSVAITGGPVDGEGFFDPGAGFPSRLGARVGGGIRVNRVDYASPTSLTLDVSTECAANGSHPVTIVNPDGQSVTAAATLTTNIVPAPTRTPPLAPVLGGSAAGDTVSLVWASAATGCGTDSFVLEAGSAPGARNLYVGPTAATTFAARVPPGVYYVRVRGVNDVGTSSPSNEVALYVGVSPPPGAPSQLAGAVSGTTVAFSWRSPASGGPVQAYLLDAGSGPGLSDIGTFPVSASARAFQAAGVPPGTYYVRVRAQNTSGSSVPSNEVVIAVACQVPGAPTGLAFTVAPGGQVALIWTAPTAGAPASGYRVEAGSGAGLANLAVLLVPAAPTTFATTGVPPGTYFVRIVAVNAWGVGGQSNEVVVVVP